MWEDDPRTERRLHHALYSQLQSEVQSAERAIADARDFIYYVLADKVEKETLDAIGNNWLDAHGRNALREPDIRPDADS